MEKRKPAKQAELIAVPESKELPSAQEVRELIEDGVLCGFPAQMVEILCGKDVDWSTQFQVVTELALLGFDTTEIRRMMNMNVATYRKVIIAGTLPAATQIAMQKGEIAHGVAEQLIKAPASVQKQADKLIQKGEILTGEALHELKDTKRKAAAKSLPASLFQSDPLVDAQMAAHNYVARFNGKIDPMMLVELVQKELMPTGSEEKVHVLSR